MKVFVAVIKHRAGVNHRFFAVENGMATELKFKMHKLDNTSWAVMPIYKIPQNTLHAKVHVERGAKRMFIGGESCLGKIYFTGEAQPKCYLNHFDAKKCK